MGVDVASAASVSSCFSQWSRYSNHSPSSSSFFHQTTNIASVFSSLFSTTTTTRGRIIDHQKTRSPILLGTHRIPIRSRSLDIISTRGGGGSKSSRSYPHTITRAISADLYDNSFDDDDDEEIVSRRLQELANQKSTNDDSSTCSPPPPPPPQPIRFSPTPPPPPPPSAVSWPAQIHGHRLEEEYWLTSDHGLFPEKSIIIERKANNSSDLPLSLRMIKQRKKKKNMSTTTIIINNNNNSDGETSATSSSPVTKAFSSMVFIIEELQRYTLHMRQLLCLQENLQGILTRIQGDMHASFVWLFQQIFSCTPTLMLSLMLLLANFTFHSMSAHAAPPTPPSAAVAEHHHHPSSNNIRFDHSSIKTFSVVDSGRSASVGSGGSNGGGGGGKARPVAGETGDGWRSGIPSALHDGITRATTTTTDKNKKEEEEEAEEEARLWNRMVEEASKMQAALRDEALMDPHTLQQFVSPVTVEVEPDDTSTYSETEAMYRQSISQDPNNPLLLCNFAQFLHLVLHDHDRAEYYFKQAVRTEPADAESLGRYASFLWIVRNDIGAAEETYLEAIAADPSNTFHAANYAHFLWSTGGEDTCYPLE